MKKYITLAALLAAGTAFASAAATDNLVAYWSFDTNGSYVSYTGVTANVNTGLTDAMMHSTGGIDGKGYISSSVTVEGTTTNMDFYSALNAFGVSASNFTISFKAKALTADYRTLLSFNIGSTQYTLQTENSNNGNDVCLYGSNIEITDDAARSALRATDGSWANVIVTGNGTTLTLNINGLTDSVAYTPGEDVILSNFQLSSTWEDGTRRATADYDDLAIWNRTLSSDEIAVLATGGIATAIPEPSAFGLLAGLGALALVGTRRRRK